MPDSTVTLANDGAPIVTSTYADGGGAHHGKNVTEFVEGGAPTAASTAAPLPVEEASRAALQNGAIVAIGPGAGGTTLIAANAARVGLIIRVEDGSAVRIGTTGVTVTTGIRLAVGDSPLVFSGSATPLNIIKAISESGTTNVYVQELVRV